MLQTDFPKTLDGMNHAFPFRVVANIGCGFIVCEHVRMAHAGCSTRLIMHFSVTNPVTIHASVRQGYPLSLHLLSLYFEPSCPSIVDNGTVRRFCFQATEVEVLEYVDDVSILYVDRKSMSAAALLTQRFCKTTGFEVNVLSSCKIVLRTTSNALCPD